MWTEETFKLVRDGIDAARDCHTVQLEVNWKSKVRDRANDIDMVESQTQSQLNIVIFHVKIPDKVSKIDSPDIKGGDHGTVDYEALLALNLDICKWSQPNANIFVITDDKFYTDLNDSENLQVIRLGVKREEPMFERVLTMCSFLQSKYSSSPTIFLDIDAFILSPLSALFQNNFDVGLTHRHIVGQMSINEGVIFSNNLNLEKTRMFFESYLASYLTLEKSDKVKNIYTNIRRWRGGQLAINAAAGGSQFYSTSTQTTSYGCKVAYLPCSKYNLSQINEKEVNTELRTRASILHLKGNRKGWVSNLIASLGHYGFSPSLAKKFY